MFGSFLSLAPLNPDSNIEIGVVGIQALDGSSGLRCGPDPGLNIMRLGMLGFIAPRSTDIVILEFK